MINDKGVIVRVQSSMVLNQVIHGKHSLDCAIEEAYKDIDDNELKRFGDSFFSSIKGVVL